MTTATLTFPYRFIMRNERSLVVFLAVLSIISVGMYIYGVIGTTIEVTERRILENEIRLANTRISELEIAYFNTISDITIEHARELGFREAETFEFAYATTGSEFALVR